MNDLSLSVLRAVAKGAATLAQINDRCGFNAKPYLPNLQTHKLVSSDKIEGSTMYEITYKARRFLAALSKPNGEVAGSRGPVSADTYRGETAEPARAGAMHAYTLPSLIDGVEVERRRPIIIGANAVGNLR